jgi:Mn-dependent DtxR family transcriptional regulator
MPRHNSPPPSRAAERLKEYLDIVEAAQAQRGKALWYDFYRRAGNQYQTSQTIKYLQDNSLIVGNKDEGYTITQKGQAWHDILKKHQDFIGVLTRELSGERKKRRW